MAIADCQDNLCEPEEGIEPSTFFLPRKRSTTEPFRRILIL